MRNSLALLGIPDLPIRAFRHVGDRRIQPQGGVSSIVESVSEVVGTASDAVSGVVRGVGGGGGGGLFGDVFGGISDAISDVGSSVSDAAADLDDTVNQEVPGGWATVASIAVPVAAPYIQAANVLDRGGSLEDAAKAAVIGQVASQVGAGVGAEAGSFAGNVAGGTTGGLLSGKSLEESVKGGVISGGVSQVTPSSLFTPSATTATQDYVPELNIGQGTPTSGTTGATNMADNFDYSQIYDYGTGNDYSGYSPYGSGGEGFDDPNAINRPMTPEEIDATMQTYGGNSAFDSATQLALKKLLAAGGKAAQGAMNFLGQNGVIQGGLGAIGSLRQIEADKQAAIRAQENLARATQQGVTGSQFRPVGTTTRFGTSNFQVDPTTGQLISAGYTSAPEISSAQNRLMSLGSSYLAQTPEEVAQQYMTRQYDLLDPSRQRQLANIRNQQFQTGRGGLSVGSTGLRPSGALGLMGANPELEAYYNSLAQQDAQLAAQAQQAGQQQVSFGTGLFGQAGQLEQLAQQPFNLSQGLAQQSSLSGYRAGDLGYRGALAGGVIGRSASATVNPYARALTGLADPSSLFGNALGQSLSGLFTDQFGGTPQGANAQLGQYLAGALANPQTPQAKMLAAQEFGF